MIKKYSLNLLMFLCMVSAFAQTTILEEDFRTGALPAGWSDLNITYSTAAGGYARYTNQNSLIETPVIDLSNYSNVTLTFDVAKFGTGTDGPLTVEVSDDGGTTWVAQTYNSPTPSSSTYLTSGPTAITATGNSVKIRILRTNSLSQKRFRDFLLEGDLAACTAPADPNGSITGATPACASTTLTYTGTDTTPALLINYWQIAADGTDTTNDAVNTYNVTSSGTYYVRKYDVLADCWSDNSVSYAVVIDPASPTINTQPSNQSVLAPATANFTIADTNGTSYQWEVSTNGGANWNPVAGGTGANTASYTTGATSVAMNNYQYRCVVTNSCGTTNSNAAILTVSTIADVVITEIMYNPPGIDDYEWIEICNLNGTAQDISNYTIDANNITRFTFPASTSIPANSCITVVVGHEATSPPPECPFTPDYQNPPTGTNNLNNGGTTVELVASDGTTAADIVSYDDADSNATDGNGSSFHVIDATLDNSDTATNWQAVPDGGSPGDNTLTSPCSTFNPEINVEGDVGAFPDISDGDTTPQGTDNTLFATIPIASSQTKSYRIQNTASVGDLIITDIYLGGANPGDFSIDPTLVFPITVSASSLITFEVTFTPTAAGQRNATVFIDNNDLDEDPYDFAIRGTGSCAASAITMTPTSGPVGTVVTVTGSNYGGLTTATVNSINATVNVISSTVIEVTIPTGADTSFIEINDDLGCIVSDTFVVLTDDVTSCEGGSASIPAGWTDLMISGLFDNSSGSCHYLELFNPTSSNINLSGYNIRLSNNQSDANDPFGYTSSPQALSGTINAESTIMIQFGNTGSTCSDCPNITPDITITDSAFGINGTGSGGIDRVVLLNGTTEVDLWANTDFANAGYVYLRDTNSTAPNMTFTNTDWSGQGTADCFGFQLPDFVDPPMITQQPSAPASNCDITATLTVNATEGFTGGNPLAYQWYYAAPGDTSWTAVTNNATYSGATTNTLNILNTLNTIDYQFYCQVRENGATCFESSHAVRISAQRTIWTGGSWSNGAPDATTIAIIDGAYNTGTNGNIDACQLIVNANNTLNVANSSYVRVVNNVINNGTLTVQTRGAFVQDGIGTAGSGTSGTFTNNGTALVNKTTDTFDSSITGLYNYTYWSSPVTSGNIVTIFPNAIGNRRFYFEAQNYLDETAETGNDNGTVDGQDDIDDNGNDWQIAGSAMDVGRGYAVTAVAPPMPNALYSDSASFMGEFNTGDVLVDIYKNDTEALDNNWNFIGNPYPSAISASDFLTENTFLSTNPAAPLQGAIFLWSQGSPAVAGNNGNENWNFSQNDYAIINGMMGTAGGNGVSPDPYIPSGQGFFVAYDHAAPELDANGQIKRNQVRFINTMRQTANNDQFFEVLDQSETIGESRNSTDANAERLWVNLTSDNGVFSQIGIGYNTQATDDYDGWYFDAPRNLSTDTYAILYSLIANNNMKYAIQGKHASSLTLEEVIPLGFKTIIEEATLFSISISQFEGVFFESNTIYLKDTYLNIIHDLSNSDYIFTSEVGEFNDRFEIVFTLDALSTNEFEINNGLTIIEATNGLVTFRLNGPQKMESIEIIDLLGRTVYNLNANGNAQETFNLSKLSRATYIAKVTLDNGYVITKKAIKRK